jgi:hypothetical protein
MRAAAAELPPAGGYGVSSSGGLRDFFDLATPGGWDVVAILGGTGLAVTGLVLTGERFVPDFRPLRPLPHERRERPKTRRRANSLSERTEGRRRCVTRRFGRVSRGGACS